MNAADLKGMAKKQPIGVACGAIALICAALLYLRSDRMDEDRGVYEEKAKTDRAILANVANSQNLPQQTEAIQHAAEQSGPHAQ